MIPIRLKELKDRIDKKLPAIPKTQVEGGITCECSKVIKPSKAFIYMDRNGDSLHTSCEQCLRIALSSNSVAYQDTLEVFQKREKSGWFKNFMADYRNIRAKERAKDATDKKSS